RSIAHLPVQKFGPIAPSSLHHLLSRSILRRTWFSSALSLAILMPMFVATDVLAAEHTFKLYNNVRATMTSFRVRGAEVDGFSRTKGGQTLTVRVIMPEGQCEGFVQA